MRSSCDRVVGDENVAGLECATVLLVLVFYRICHTPKMHRDVYSTLAGNRILRMHWIYLRGAFATRSPLGPNIAQEKSSLASISVSPFLCMGFQERVPFLDIDTHGCLLQRSSHLLRDRHEAYSID